MNDYDKLISFIHANYYSDLKKEDVAKRIMSDSNIFDSSLRLYHKNSGYSDRVPYDKYKQAILQKRGDPFAQKDQQQGQPQGPAQVDQQAAPAPEMKIQSQNPEVADPSQQVPTQPQQEMPPQQPVPQRASLNPYAAMSPLLSEDPSTAEFGHPQREYMEFPDIALPKQEHLIGGSPAMPVSSAMPAYPDFSEKELRDLGFNKQGQMLDHRSGKSGYAKMRAELWERSAKGMVDPIPVPKEFQGKTAPLPDVSNPEYRADPKNPAVTLYSFENFGSKSLSRDGLTKYLNDLAEWYKGEPALYSNEKEFYDRLGVHADGAPVLEVGEQEFVLEQLAKQYTLDQELFQNFLENEGYDPEKGGVTQFLSRVGRSGLEGFAKMDDAITRGFLRNIYQPPVIDRWEERTGKDFTDFRPNILRELSKKLSINPTMSDDFFQGKVADAIGSTIPFIASGSPAAAAIMGALQNAESQYQDAIRNGANKEGAFDAFYVGLPVGALEGMLGSGKAAGSYWRTIGKISKEGGRRAIIRATMNAAKEGSEEAIQESMTQLLNNASAKAIYDETRGYMDGMGENAAIGFVTGAMFGGLRSAAQSAARGDFSPRGDQLRRLVALIDINSKEQQETQQVEGDQNQERSQAPDTQVDEMQGQENQNGQQEQGNQEGQPAQEGQGQEPTTEEAPAKPERRLPVREALGSDGVFEREGEAGFISQEGQQVVFETANRVYELGNVDEVSDGDISDFGITQQERLNVEVDGEFGVSIDDKRYNNLYSDKMAAINRDENGKIVSVTLQSEDGKNKTIRGQNAQEIAYQYTLLNLETNGTNEQIEALEGAISEAEAEQATNEKENGDSGTAGTLSKAEQQQLAEETVSKRIDDSGVLSAAGLPQVAAPPGPIQPKTNEKELPDAQEKGQQTQASQEGQQGKGQQEAAQVEAGKTEPKTTEQDGKEKQGQGPLLEGVQTDTGQEGLQQGELSKEGKEEVGQPEVVKARNGTEVSIQRDPEGNVSGRARTLRGEEYEIEKRDGKWMERRKSGSKRPWRNLSATISGALTKQEDSEAVSGVSSETDVALNDNFLIADEKGNLSPSTESGRGSLQELLDEDMNEESAFRKSLVSELSERRQKLLSEVEAMGGSSPRRKRALNSEANRIDRVLEQIEGTEEVKPVSTPAKATPKKEPGVSLEISGPVPVQVNAFDGTRIPERMVESAEKDLGVPREDLEEFAEEVRAERAKSQQASKDGDSGYQPERGPAGERILAKARSNPKAMNNSVVQEAKKMRMKGYNNKRKSSQERQPLIRAVESAVKQVRAGARPIVEQVSSAFTAEARTSVDGTEGRGGIRAQVAGAFEAMVAAGEAIGKENAVSSFEEALRKYPDISALYQSVAAQIEAMDSVTSEMAKALGFSSKADLAKAISSQIIFNPSYKQSGKFAPSVSESPTRANTVEHYAQTMARAEERRARINEQRTKAKISSRSINQLVDGSGPNDGNASEKRVRAENARVIRDRLWSKVATILQKAFPKIDLQIPSSDEWIDIANDLGKDPSMVKGFYYDGTIYLNPDLGTDDTLVHEYAHVWLYAWRNSNPVAFDEMARQVIGTSYYSNLPQGYEGDNAIYEAMAQMIGDHATQQFKLGNKRPYTNLVDKVMGAVYKLVGLDWKGSLDVTRARMDDFLSVATRDLFSNREISTIASFNLAEFSGLESRTRLKNDTAEAIEKARQKAEDILRGGLSGAQRFRALIQDSHLFIYIAQERIKADKGSLGGLDVYRDMGLVNGAVQVEFEELLSKLKGDDTLRSDAGREASREKSILGRLWDEHGVSWEELGTYMYAVHAKARNEYVRGLTRDRQLREAKRILKDGGKNPETMTDEQILKATQKEIISGSGMTDDQANQIMEKIKAEGKLHIYEQFANEVRDQIMKPVNQKLIDAEVRTEEDQQELDDMFGGTYVPLHVKKESLFGKRVRLVFTGGSRSMKAVRGPGIKGTDSFSYEDRVNPIAGIIQDAQRDLMTARKNSVMKNLARLIRENPSEKWDVEAAKYMPERNSDGEITNVRKRDMPKDATPFYENGKLMYVRTSDNDFYEALNGNSFFNWLNGTLVVRFLQKFTAFRRAMLTTWNIAFAPKNLGRDYLSGMTVLDGLIPDRKDWSRARMTILIPVVMKAVVKSEKGEESENESTKYIQGMIYRMQKAGGIISWIDYERASKSMKNYNKELSRANKRKTVLGTMVDYTARKPAKAIANTVYLYNQMMEQAVRVSAFTIAVESGMSDADAANVALNITVNFNRKGHAGVFLNSLFLFSNAGIQGSHMLLHNVKKSGKVRATMGAIVASSIAMSAFNAMIAGSNDDEEYDKITDAERRSQAFFTIPGVKDIYPKIPLGYGMNVPFALGHQIYKLGLGKTDLPSAAVEMMQISESTFNPFSDGYGGMTHSLTPDFLLPFYEIENNVQFPDKPIYKEGFGAMGIRPSQAYFKGVSGTSKAITDWLAGNYEGGPGLDEDGKPRVAWTTFPQGVDINPEIIDYSINYLIGGAGKVIQNSIDTGKSLGDVISFSRTGDPTLDEIWQKAKEDVDVNKLPIARGFIEDATKMEWRDGSFLRKSLEEAAKKKFVSKEIARVTRIYQSQDDKSAWVKGNMANLVEAQKQRQELDGATEEEKRLLEELEWMTKYD